MKYLISLLVLLIINFSVAGQKPVPRSQNDEKSTLTQPFFPFSEIRKGMRATAYTVFEGTEPKPFELEVLGTMEGFNAPKQNAIIVRLLGADTDRSGVFAGMSGSPVYIDGKLVGAIAFAYNFSKEAIGGITPIQDMVDIFEQRKSEDKIPSAPRSISFSEISFNENSKEFSNFLNPNFSATTNVSNVNSPVLKPIATPLSITGVPTEVIERFAAQFQSFGLMPVAGAASAAKITELVKADSNTLKPGSTIVVPLVRGDFSLDRKSVV